MSSYRESQAELKYKKLLSRIAKISGDLIANLQEEEEDAEGDVRMKEVANDEDDGETVVTTRVRKVVKGRKATKKKEKKEVTTGDLVGKLRIAMPMIKAAGMDPLIRDLNLNHVI